MDMSTIEQFRGRMISPKACAKMLDNSEHTIHRWIKGGKIKAVKMGYRMTRVDGDSLADFLESRAVIPATVAPLSASVTEAVAKRKVNRLATV